MKNALIMMTRIPVPGKTKTRLMDTLNGNQCAELHKKFLLDLFNMCNSIKHTIDLYLTYTPEGDISTIKDMIPKDINIFPQQGEDLGDRMKNSINKLLEQGYKKVVLIGTDIPEIQPSYIKKAFDILEDKEVCFGPTMDGGYYLVGMNNVYDCIFSKNIKWGNKSVLEGTVDIANRNGISVGLTDKCNDIDTKLDIIHFMKKVNLNKDSWECFPKNTVELIEDYWSDKNVKTSIKG